MVKECSYSSLLTSLIQNIVKNYFEDSLPFSIELVNAVIHQRRFIDDMVFNQSVNEYANQSKAINRYKKFLILIKSNRKNLVPTKDIDLCWHTHMLYAPHYRCFTKKYLGKIMNYDNKISESILSENFDETSNIWREKFNESYDDNTPIKIQSRNWYQ
ncbi:797_t:CDS:2, partial [Scutellospora calospora]